MGTPNERASVAMTDIIQKSKSYLRQYLENDFCEEQLTIHHVYTLLIAEYGFDIYMYFDDKCNKYFRDTKDSFELLLEDICNDSENCKGSDLRRFINNCIFVHPLVKSNLKNYAYWKSIYNGESEELLNNPREGEF